MKTHKITIVIVMSYIFMTSFYSFGQQASGNVLSREFQVAEFNGIDLNEPLDYIILQGDKGLVKIETDDNLMDKVKTEVKNGVLMVDTRALSAASSLKITIQVKDLNSIKTASASTLTGQNTINSNDLKIDALGASEIKLEVNAAVLTTSLSGAARLTLSGNAEKHSIKASGAADLKAEDLKTSITDVKLSGASSARVDVADKLTGNVSGVSSLKYNNKPAQVELDESEIVSIPNIDSLVKEALILKNDEQILIDKEVDIEKKEKEHHEKGDFFDKVPGKLLKSKKNKTPIHWTGIGFGINGYLNSETQFDMPVNYEFMQLDYGKSWFVDLNFIEYGLPIIKNYWHLVTGMGFQINNYVIEKNVLLKPNTDYLEAFRDTTAIYKKNKLTNVYFQIPLLFQFDTKKIKKNNTFHLLFGVVGGVRVNSHTKQKFEIDESKNTQKTWDDFNLAPFRWNAMVKLGYGPVNLFATYQLNQMFKPDHGPKLYPFTVGIALLGF